MSLSKSSTLFARLSSDMVFEMRLLLSNQPLHNSLHDCFSFNESTGDATARWEADGITYATNGHVFTHQEFCRLSQRAGLTIKKFLVIDYRTGEIRRWTFEGSLFYVLQRAETLPLEHGKLL